MMNADLDQLPCQNGQQLLFGPSPEQWSVADAETFTDHLVELWNTWK